MKKTKKIIHKVLNKVGIKISFIPKSPPYISMDKNAIVSNKVGDYVLTMNHAHIHNAEMLSEQYSKNLPRIVVAVFSKYSKFQVIDVGANIGDSVALIKSSIDVPIVCIEGDDFYFEILKKNIEQFKNVTAFKNYLSEVDEEIKAKAVQDSGSLKIDIADKSATLNLKKFDTLVSQHPQSFSTIKVFKVDTDGFDLKVLKGSKEIFKRDKPVVFFEYSEKHLKDAGDDGLSIFPFFKALEYKYIMFYDYNGRFIFSTELENELQLKQIHAYISNYSAPLQFLDIAVFHKDDKDIYEKIVLEEMEINKLHANRLIPNK